MLNLLNKKNKIICDCRRLTFSSIIKGRVERLAHSPLYSTMFGVVSERKPVEATGKKNFFTTSKLGMQAVLRIGTVVKLRK